jgi:hypothetical protein
MRNAIALASSAANAPVAGPMTYDAALASDGRHIGLRPLRAEEFHMGLDGAGTLANARVSSSAVLSAPKTINSLTLDRRADLTLDADLRLGGGVLWHSAWGDSADAPRVSGGGKIVSPLPLQILASRPTTGSLVLDLDVPIEAPAIVVAGNGSVRLSGENSVADFVGVEANGGLIIAHPGALGRATLRVGLGAIRFEGDQVLSNPVHFVQGDASSSGYSFSSSGLGVDEGRTVTFNGPLSGVGAIIPANGLLRINGGGSFSGMIGNPFRGALEINGTYTTVFPGRTLRASGTLFGNAIVPLVYEHGQLSPGARDATGQMHIHSLDQNFFSTQSRVLLIDLDGASADRLILTDNEGPAPLPGARLFTLSLALLSAPVPMQTHLIVEILDPTAPQLTFANVVEGGTLSAGGYDFRVSYVGGDGNDVTLTVLPEPGSLLALALMSVLPMRRR